MITRIKHFFNTGTNKNKSAILNMPDEILINIFGFFGSRKDVQTARLACKHFARLGADRHLLKGFPVASDFTQALGQRMISFKPGQPAAVSGANNLVAIVREKEGLCLLDARGQLVARLAHLGVTSYQDLQFSPDGNYLVALTQGSVHVWDVTKRELAHDQPVAGAKIRISFPDKDRYLIDVKKSDSSFHTFAIHDLKTGACEKKFDFLHELKNFLLGYKECFITANSNEVRFYDKHLNRTQSIRIHTPLRDMVITTGKYMVATGLYAVIIDLEKRKLVKSVNIKHTLFEEAEITGLAMSEDGKYFALMILDPTKQVVILETETGERVNQMGCGEQVERIFFMGNKLVMQEKDRVVLQNFEVKAMRPRFK